MKIAFFSKLFSVGGTEKHVYELAKHFSMLGEEVRVYTSFFGEEKKFRFGGFKVVNLPCLASLKNYYYFSKVLTPKKVIYFLKREKPDIVHAHLFSLSTEFVLPKVKTGTIPLVLTPHISVGRGLFGRLIGEFSIKLVKSFFKEADAIIAVTPQLRFFLEKRKVKVSRVIPNGVDTDKFSPGKSNFKKEIEADKTIVFVGRVSPEKNLVSLFKAFSLISRTKRNVKLVIVGKGPLLETYKRKFSSGKIIFTGYVEEKRLIDILRSADVFAFPSLAEAQGIACLEAMSCGVPVVASNIGGVPYNLKWGGGKLVNPLKPKEIAEKILFYLENEEIARADGIKGREIVERRFSWQKVCRETLSLYKELLS